MAEREEIDQVWSEYQDVVNMTASELERWADNPCSRRASLDRSPITRNLHLLRTPKSEWGDREVRDAKRTIAFVRRMSAGRQGRPVSEECPLSRRDISLRNWAFDPRKKTAQKSGRLFTIRSRLPSEVETALTRYGAEPRLVVYEGWAPDPTALIPVVRDAALCSPGATLVGVGYLDGSDRLVALASCHGLVEMVAALERVGAEPGIENVAGVELTEIDPGPIPDVEHVTWRLETIELWVGNQLVYERVLSHG